ncbi:hypothetical protein ABFS82_12G111200 [Erythranthe guttata]|uniref:TPX2 C-terminal domain-containing protein n=1 Tax=Erythranthe guttata TaxID=4155 RepID=A0A022QL28_ERYGU|nr:PREDICTED: neurofilament medium polypeptide [Erythranthe guttata]XP_012847583.1 PREDICTED: neurofilament medium polypeptide [Erythranthe guttata]XP_012847584.1 PREDICTED: neurofilament medium polypeptide [Erythranthe guttata]EYU28656.1 hypothetical protein MIMGU_mgv1a0052221mg [Erythranthe guttata]|eukprot:XP_012847582.1 PREDICTED: neurofilament medium polypeptide [Erythranthe guttata]
MDDSVKSDSRLEVSVSFGRFENDALSWEKWSSFSPNKYLEEVGTLSTPGSVAQKKAYFEAHYKKIAAKKAEEELDQEKSDPVVLNADVSSNEEHIEDSSFVDSEFGLSNGERLLEEVEQEDCIPVITNLAGGDDVAKDDDARSSEVDEHVINVISLEEEIADASVAKDELSVNVDESELDVGKDPVLVGLKNPQKHPLNITEKPPERKNERKNGTGQTVVLKKESSKSNARIVAQKVTPTKIERNNSAVTKKKVISPSPKSLQASSTPKFTKPISISTPISASSKKKVSNGSQSQLSKSRNIPVREIKRVAPTSLHMSLSLGPGNSLSGLPLTRKSLIMEQMGDKDIVKRAFKTFQNRTNVSTSDEKLTATKHVSSAPLKQKTSTSSTSTKGNEGVRKDVEKRATQRSEVRARSNPVTSGPHKSSALDRKNTKAAASPTTTGITSDEKAEKRKEFLKKLEAKSIIREAENAQLTAKSKVGMENGTRQRPTLSR